MIPTVVSEYTRPSSLADALTAVADGAKPIAGGMSLVPMMRLRLVAPERLVDLAGVNDLAGISEQDGMIVIGALTRHRDLAASPLLRRACPALSSAAAGVGSPAVRNRGTIGGSLAHADPHADLPAVLVALDAVVSVQSASGRRSIAAGDLVTDYLTTSLADDELIVDIRVAPHPACAYVKFHRRSIDWAIVGAAAALRNGGVRVALTGVANRPVRASDFEAAIAGGEAPEQAQHRAGVGLSPMEDLDGSAEYKRHLAGVLARRAVEQARSL